jgi:hypothetical protein
VACFGPLTDVLQNFLMVCRFCQLVVNTTLYPALLVDLGPVWEQVASRGTQWFTFVLSVLMTGWFVYNFYTGHCGWEVIFVTTIGNHQPPTVKALRYEPNPVSRVLVTYGI